MSPIHERVGHCVALYRKPTYSPQQHLANDAAIMDSVVQSLEHRGWRLTRCSEADLEENAVPSADLYLNMCQGPAASEQLVKLERAGAMIVNPPSSVLACHRHRLVRRLNGSGIPFPRTLIIPTWLAADDARALSDFVGVHASIWIKRGDVHAETSEDVVLARADQVLAALARFAVRGISRVAVQEHVRGPVIKFYGVADQGFFRFYDSKLGPNGPAPGGLPIGGGAAIGNLKQRMLIRFVGQLHAERAIESLYATAWGEDHRQQLFEAAVLPGTVKGGRPAYHEDATAKLGTKAS